MQRGFGHTTVLEQNDAITLVRIQYDNGVRVALESNDFTYGFSVAILDNFLVIISKMGGWRNTSYKNIQLPAEQARKLYGQLMAIQNSEQFGDLFIRLTSQYQP